MLKYKLINKLDSIYSETQIISGFLGSELVSGRSIAIPFTEQTKNDGYSDLVNQLFIEEKDQNVNPVIDNETIEQ